MKRAAPLLTLALFACTAATAPQTTPAPASLAAEQDCGDFLGQTGRKPVHLDYVGCSYAPYRQGKPLVATYRVPAAMPPRSRPIWSAR